MSACTSDGAPARAAPPTHRPDALVRLQRRQVVEEAPRELPKPLLVALLGVHGAAQRVPQLRQQDLHLCVCERGGMCQRVVCVV